MTTELEIAKENIKDWKTCYGICSFHKETCQRFLKFLIKIRENSSLKNRPDVVKHLLEKIDRKITDLKQAIEEYKKNGI